MSGANNKRRGYDAEKLVAELVGGRRTGGDQGGLEGDVQTTTQVWEVKSRSGYPPAYVRDAMRQVEASASRTGLEPHIALVYRPGRGVKPIVLHVEVMQ